jgi:hypothetical protein
MNKIVIGMLAGVGAFVLVGMAVTWIYVAGRDSKYSEYTTPVKTVVPPQDDVDVYVQAKNEFMNGCDNGTNTSSCSCIWESMIRTTSLAELERDGNTLSEAQIVAKYQNEIYGCL